MTTVLAPHAVHVKSHVSTSPVSSQNVSPGHEPASPIGRRVKHELHERGRRRRRSGEDDDDADVAVDGEDGKGASSNSDGRHRKRRRSRKGLDKKFECPHEACGKSYSRAEHLYRHQLNHTPKQIYACDYPDCHRTFVRLDLCNRHRDRHTAKGSSLGRRDSFIGQNSPPSDRAGAVADGSNSPEAARPNTTFADASHLQSHLRETSNRPFLHPVSTSQGYSMAAQANTVNGFTQHDGGFDSVESRRGSQSDATRLERPSVSQASGAYICSVSDPQSYKGQRIHSTPQSTTQVSRHCFASYNMPSSDFSGASYNVSREQDQQYGQSPSAEYTHQISQESGEFMDLDQMAMAGNMPVFGSDGILNKSPFVTIPEDFVAYLFNTEQIDGSPMPGPVVAPGYASNYGDFQSQYSVPYLGNDNSTMGYFPTGSSHQVMAVNNLLDQNLPEATISDEKSQEIYDMINSRFHDSEDTPASRQRDSILGGDRSDSDHMLSKRMMQAYIASYWAHFSDQVPILHKPTFSPDRTRNPLLLAMMTIGAALLDKTHGHSVTKAGAQLSNFLAWHLRWETFMDVSFRPPAKLWVFQTLLLLELYEKMYSTRELHERAHIHHATTITLMRRGRSLTGKCTLDSPPNSNFRDDKVNGSRHSSTPGAASTADEWWNHWITNEATRRCAFAAFIIDSIHATMFGHSTVMVTHEMRLPLPCDESLWQATSGAEVGRLEANMASNGMRPVSFLEGLKRTLSYQEVQATSFGRTILMAGLLSVSWHMNQRDLQVNVLGGGITQTLGGRDKWRGTLTRAFDAWREDFDKALKRTKGTKDPYRFDAASRNEANVVFESRTVLHHLAHMAMHVDIVECQVFARARRLLGRAIGPQDVHSATRRMKEQWAPSAKARDATWYALRFLCSVLVPDETPLGATATPQSAAGGQRASASPPSMPGEGPYTARDDVLLNRPWVLYFSALVVWCYGFALEGPCPGAPAPTDQQEKRRLMREYLTRYGSVETPEQLKNMRGMNANTALLMVLRDSFATTRWELLQEGATLLGNCVELNSGATL